MGLLLLRLRPRFLRCCHSQNCHHLTDVNVQLKRCIQWRPAKASNNCKDSSDLATYHVKQEHGGTSGFPFVRAQKNILAANMFEIKIEMQIET